MTQASLTAELNYHNATALFHASQERQHRARVSEIEQQLADMGCGLLREPKTSHRREPLAVTTFAIPATLTGESHAE